MLSRIKTAKLNNFRNHESLRLDIDKDIIAIYGQNGTGKTNILEAISNLATGRGLRNAKLSDMSYFDGQKQAPWSLFFKAEGKDGEVEIGMGINAEASGNDSRIVKVNGEKVRSQNAIAEHLSVIWLTPAEDQVFVGGSTSRREFLDRLCNFFYPDYSSLLGAFGNMKSQRRNLLMKGNYNEQWLSSIEETMAEKAVALSHFRNEVVKKLNHTISDSEEYNFPSANLSILGEIENNLIENPSDSPESYYRNVLVSDRIRDAESGRTNSGPHRSDFRVVHNIKKMPTELCSQGEQKALLLSLTIAAVLAKKRFSGDTPILLLDEVYSHLDEEKRAALYDFISNTECQTWLTGTEKESFQGLENCQFISLKK